MKKILIVSYDYRPKLGGVATCGNEVARHLSQNHQVFLLAPSMAGDKEFDQEQPFKTKRVSLPKAALFSIIPLSFQIRKAVKEYNPDLIINLLWMPDAIATFLARTQKPYYIFTHAVEIIEVKSTLKKRIRSLLYPLKKSVFANATKIFCVSRFTQRLVGKYCKVKKENTKLIYNGVDINRFIKKSVTKKIIPNQDKLVNLNKTIFLTVTRLDPFKGIDSALLALSALKKNNQNQFIYLIAGIGKDELRIKNLIHKLDLDNEVILLGKIKDEDLVDLYNLCDVFVLLSRIDKKTPNVEGFGLVFLEANACSKPVIGARSGGITSAVMHGRTGLLVNPRNTQEIGDAMTKLMASKDLRNQYGKAGREWCETEMNWKTVAQKISQTIEM